MKAIYQWAEGIILFMILSSILLNLGVGGKYRKYLKMFTGMLLVIIVITPVLKLFKLKDGYDFRFDTMSAYVEMGDMGGMFAEAENAREQEVMTQYKQGLLEQAEEAIANYGYETMSISFEVGEEESSAEYLRVLSIEGVILKEDKEEEVDARDKTRIRKEVEQISVEAVDTIAKVRLEETEQSVEIAEEGIEIVEETRTLEEENDIEMIKKRLADFYNIEAGNINICIQEAADGA